MFENLIGHKYNMLTVIGWVGTKVNTQGRRKDMWLCQCDCGGYTTLITNTLKSGAQKSCGCLSFKKKLNRYDLSGDYGIGWDSNNNEFYFDKDDYDLIKDYTWSQHTDTKYIRSSSWNSETQKTCEITMHRLVMNAHKLNNKNIVVDHINGHRNDNRKDNLRFATYSQNMWNSDVSNRNTSGVRGVKYEKECKRWRATINCHGKRYDLGSYKDKEDAITARKQAEKKFYGEYCFDSCKELNIPEEELS